MLHALIMAGGVGTRFWPESRMRTPKQFLQLLGKKSMIRATADRLDGLITPDRLWVATTTALAGQVIDQLPELPVESIVVEPCARNTAPCIGLAAVCIAQRDPEATMVVLPADHAIEPADAFRHALGTAEALVDDENDALVTFGIRPTYPAESFGYIERGDRFEETAVQLGLTKAAETPAGVLPVYRVRQFREKPTAERAKNYLAKGTFLWNSGIFVWRAKTILRLLQRHQADLYARLAKIGAALGTPGFIEVVRREFAAMPSISIDYAVMEHAQNVLVVEAPFTWDDLGSWQAIARRLGADGEGNTVSGRHVGLKTSGTIIRTTGDHLVATIGVKDLIIVQTPDATLVANKHDEESVRQLVAELRQRGLDNYL